MSKKEYSSMVLATKTEEELVNSIHLLKQEAFNLRFRKAFSDVSNLRSYRNLRRNVARLKTQLSLRKTNKE